MREYSFLACLLICLSAKAQTFDVDTVLKNGPVSERINLVFLGDGYTAGEQTKFITDVNKILTALFAQSPFKEYKSYFNAYAIKVISQESGANHPQNSTDGDGACPAQAVKSVDNYFGSTFDYLGIHRLLYPNDLGKVATVLAANFPLYDQAFIAINTPYYGGAGGSFATCSDHSAGREVAIHEIGHSFAGLADEYWAGAQYAAEKPNMTKQTSPSLVKWKNWMGVSGVGIYAHSGDASWKKPHTNCKMGVLNSPLCKVCTETFVERFHLFVTPLREFLPHDTRFNIDPDLEQTIDFSLSVNPPEPNTLKITWEVDDVLKSKNTETLAVSSNELLATSTIRATVQDTTALTRSENHTTNHVYIVEWELTKSDVVTSIEVETLASRYDLLVYPNPAAADLKFSYKLSKPTPVSISMIDHSGRNVKTLLSTMQGSGQHESSFDRQTLGLSAGEYVLQFKFGKATVPVKVILH
ncbi:MAG TPA: M64 family metallopeptidase [Cyclobacteriaceae bacterium]|nr:T9SS type A sorting domain-containing protein [Cyclobacteriaceae bacterium]HMV08675.1 M64 family metallopeptidase [Cyclobacteriaceae bacterium]HMX00116.1 M64 family metallopeptidase [Cyclobacteriaceae bacterium]HMX49022.1 M64 family metallopeptidase [Cyclobacteriaceae bacterium]HMY92936.1 M64 family metallopeptidase [Cyclobacteriaceae bacterium]